MLGFIIGIGVLLLISILLMIFRIQSLVSVVKGSDKKRATGSNKWNAALGMIFLLGTGFLFFWYSFKEFDNYQLPVASEHGVVTDGLFWTTMAVTGIVFVITHILLFWFGYKYQYKENGKALYYPDNNKLELIWTVVPAVVLALLIFTGWRAWVDITEKAPEGSEEVEIMGYQFAWAVRYPGEDKKIGDYDFRLIDGSNQFGMDLTDESSLDDFVAPNVMVLPKGKPVLFKIRSRDVLHSVFAPHFRLKMDAVPGMPTRFWFTPTKTTAEMREETGNPDFTYEIACTEVCGRSHFAMRYRVEVVEPAEYEAWLAKQSSWLSQNPEYMEKVPDDLKGVAQVIVDQEKIIQK
ncbi:cytochrome c oxidase subunit II [Penaeicola halotolerans]|uniref:cytochrome c oxidase subunit II n=1 Tax=Penaeicola halotolerans TaxID=2793196 RepID=UPI001CF834B0|nr:cytochrome c oxidase subunit II [Penaeicola halotolerans]